MKKIFIAFAIGIAAYLSWRWYRRNRQRPSNWASLSPAQQAQYNALLDSADAYTGPTE